MSQSTIAFHNHLSFPVKIYRRDQRRPLNLLQPNQRYVEKVEVGTTLHVRIAYGSELEVMSAVASSDFKLVDIAPRALRSVLTEEEGTAYLNEDIELDLYRIEPDGSWSLLDGFKNARPTNSHLEGVRSGMLFVATVPDCKDSLLFLYLVTDRDGMGNYGNIIGHYYAKGFTNDEGVHAFEDVFASQAHRILPNGHLQLSEGEVVVYESADFNRGAGNNNHFWLFSGTLNDFGHYALAAGKSCIPGPNTVVTIYSDPEMRGTGQETDQGISNSRIMSFATEAAVGGEAVHIGLLNELGQDYDKSGNEITTCRTTLSINNPDIAEIYLEAEAESTVVEVEGEAYTLNPYRAASPRGLRIPINALRRVVIRQQPKADSLHIPELFVNADTMRESERIVVHRDAALHNKIASLKGDFKSNRASLGLETDTGKLPDSACDAAQKVLQSMACTALTGYHQDMAVRSTRRYDGTAMADTHWWLDNSGDAASYSRIEPGDYSSHVQRIAQDIDPSNIHDLDQGGTQSAWDWIEEGWDEVKHIGAEIADEVEKDVKATIVFVKDSVTYMYKFTLKAAAAIAGVMKAVLDAIKLAIDKLIEFIKFLFNLKKIKVVYDALYKKTDDVLARAQNYIRDTLPDAEKEIKGKLQSLRDDIISPLAGKSTALNRSQPPTGPHHSEVQEKLEWIVSVILANPHGFSFSTPGPFEQKVQHEIIKRLESTVQSQVATLKDLAQHTDAIKAEAATLLADLCGGMIDGAVNVVEDGIDLVRREAKQLEQAATSSWDLPVLKPILAFCGLSAPSPLQVVCMTYAVPVGVFCALEDIDVDGLTLDNAAVGQVLASIADGLNAISSPLTTLAIAKGKSPLPPATSVFLALCKSIDVAVVEILKGGGWMAVCMYVRAVLGYLVVLTTGKPAIINGVLDILCGIVKIGVGGYDKDEVVLVEGLGWAVELLGFTNTVGMAVGCAAGGLLFVIAGLSHLSQV